MNKQPWSSRNDNTQAQQSGADCGSGISVSAGATKLAGLVTKPMLLPAG